MGEFVEPKESDETAKESSSYVQRSPRKSRSKIFI